MGYHPITCIMAKAAKTAPIATNAFDMAFAIAIASLYFTFT